MDATAESVPLPGSEAWAGRPFEIVARHRGKEVCLALRPVGAAGVRAVSVPRQSAVDAAAMSTVSTRKLRCGRLVYENGPYVRSRRADERSEVPSQHGVAEAAEARVRGDLATRGQEWLLHCSVLEVGE